LKISNVPGRRVDLHMHSLLSDGVLLPSEIVRRAESLNYKAIAITDHADQSNLDWIIKRLLDFSRELEKNPCEVEVYIGVELTHIPPASVPILASKAKRLGAQIVVVHGETIVEPVAEGTNRAAVECGEVDILAHPGFINIEDCEKARSNEIYIELSSRKGHCLTNGHVARLSLETGVKMIVNTDFHSPEDFISQREAFLVALGSGLNIKDAEKTIKDNVEEFLKRLK
jgi:histidinol phosphatase-like PHP family hydrolase